MLTATEAKLASYRSRGYFNIVENKILDATNKGETECAINIDEIPDGTPNMLKEISYLLTELGYNTLIDFGDILNIYWHVQPPIYYNVFDDINEEEYW